MYSIMSVDVEEWFHIPVGLDNALPFDKWNDAVKRVQYVLPRLLDILDLNDVKATFFFLGWVAEKHPDLVKEAFKRGHEIASHGYAHKLIYNQTPDEFKEDLQKSIHIIEDISGRRVNGYRAPGFSVTPQTKWAFEILVESGIEYDSSVFPGKRFYGHFNEFSLEPVNVITSNGSVIEFPQTVLDFGFLRYSFFGGGYFRLIPAELFLFMANLIKKADRPLIMYIHPRDLDVEQPVIVFPFLKKIRHYINISKSERKLKYITSKIDFNTFGSLISGSEYKARLKEYYLHNL